MDYIVGGLHLYNPINKKTEASSVIHELGKQLLAHDVTVYTCHCTGLQALDWLKPIMGSRIQTINTGQVIDL